MTGGVILGKPLGMNKGFSVIIETFTAALVLAVRYELIRQQNKRTTRAIR